MESDLEYQPAKVLVVQKVWFVFSKFLFIAYDIWEQSEKAGGD
jgi:hypothetical protein